MIYMGRRLKIQVNFGRDVYWDPPDEFYVDEVKEVVTHVRDSVPPSRNNRTSEAPEEDLED